MTVVGVGRLFVGQAHEDGHLGARVTQAEDHHLRPLSTWASPSSRTVACMLVTSDEATPGSVMQNTERISPRSSGASQRVF